MCPFLASPIGTGWKHTRASHISTLHNHQLGMHTLVPDTVGPPPAPSMPRHECLRCGFPLDVERNMLTILSHVREMMSHAGYAVDRLVLQESPDDGPMSVTLDLRRAKRPRPPSPDPPAKRCRLCVSSCCSTNSLCKANACGHRNEEISKPTPTSPVPHTDETAAHEHHHHHHRHNKTHHHHHHSTPNVPVPRVFPAPDNRADPIHTFVPDRPASRPLDAAAVQMPVDKGVASSRHAGWTATTAPASEFGSRERLLPMDFPVGAAASTVGGRLQRELQMSSLKTLEPAADRPVVTMVDGKNDMKVTGEADVQRTSSEFRCNPCAIKFDIELDLRKHQFKLHKDDNIVTKTSEGRFLCLMNSCSHSFVRRHVMERHFKTVHLHVKDFACPSCPKSFADSSTRDAHRSAVHEKLKPWVCTQCSSSFTQSSSLGKHRRRFHQETLQQCQTNLRKA